MVKQFLEPGRPGALLASVYLVRKRVGVSVRQRTGSVGIIDAGVLVRCRDVERVVSRLVVGLARECMEVDTRDRRSRW